MVNRLSHLISTLFLLLSHNISICSLPPESVRYGTLTEIDVLLHYKGISGIIHLIVKGGVWMWGVYIGDGVWGEAVHSDVNIRLWCQLMWIQNHIQSDTIDIHSSSLLQCNRSQELNCSLSHVVVIACFTRTVNIDPFSEFKHSNTR